MSDADYCDMCDLPWSTCVHGNPPAPPIPVEKRVPTPRVTAASRRVPGTPAAAPVRSAPRKWTPPDDFKLEILEVLRAHGGNMEQEELFGALEATMGERLTTADRETTPEGELRWRYAARRARQALVADGIMTKGKPGVWSLAD